jgi:Flp pilus assembly protein TadD
LPDERAETVASVAYSSDAAAQHSTPSANAYAPGADGTRRKVMASGALMLESSSLDLSMALASHAREPTADSELALAQAYLRHGVLDKASEHFASASRINPREGLAWDGLARVWRAWGFPQFGLGDAYRAVSASPDSPAARNTLGTILQDLGEGAAARAQFERASALDPLAAYPLNNLCYSWLAEANVEAGLPACQRALRLDPTLAVARGNLALATAIAAQRTYKHPQP